MKQYKAQRVLQGNENYKIDYNGKEVWLESIDEKNNEALVSVVGTGEKMKIPINNLEGKGFEFK